MTRDTDTRCWYIALDTLSTLLTPTLSCLHHDGVWSPRGYEHPNALRKITTPPPSSEIGSIYRPIFAFVVGRLILLFCRIEHSPRSPSPLKLGLFIAQFSTAWWVALSHSSARLSIPPPQRL